MGASIYPFDSFGCAVQLLSPSSLVVGSSGFSSSPATVNSGAVFMFSMRQVNPGPVITRLGFHLEATLYPPTLPEEGARANTFFGKEISFTSTTAFISAFTQSFSGVVYYYEKNVTNQDYRLIQTFLPVTNGMNFVNYFGSSLVFTDFTIDVELFSLDALFPSWERNSGLQSFHQLFPKAEEEIDEFNSYYSEPDDTVVTQYQAFLVASVDDDHHNEEEVDPTEDDAAMIPPSLSNSTSFLPKFERMAVSVPLSLLFINSPGSTFSPSSDKENGMIYVYSNYRSVLRDISCQFIARVHALNITETLSSFSKVNATEILLFVNYYEELCHNYSRPLTPFSSSSDSFEYQNEWTLVHKYQAKSSIDLNYQEGVVMNAQFGKQLLLDDETLLISAPFATLPFDPTTLPPMPPSDDPKKKPADSNVPLMSMTGAVFQEQMLIPSVLNRIDQDLTILLTSYPKPASEPTDGNSDPSNGGSKENGFFETIWKGISSKNGIIVTATCLPTLTLVAIVGILYARHGSFRETTDFSRTVNTVDSVSKERQSGWKSYASSMFPSSSDSAKWLPVASAVPATSPESPRKKKKRTKKIQKHSNDEPFSPASADIEQGNNENPVGGLSILIEDAPDHSKKGSSSSSSSSLVPSFWNNWMQSITHRYQNVAGSPGKSSHNVHPDQIEVTYETYFSQDRLSSSSQHKKQAAGSSSPSSSVDHHHRGVADGKQQEGEETLEWTQNPLKVPRLKPSGNGKHPAEEEKEEKKENDSKILTDEELAQGLAETRSRWSEWFTTKPSAISKMVEEQERTFQALKAPMEEKGIVASPAFQERLRASSSSSSLYSQLISSFSFSSKTVQPSDSAAVLSGNDQAAVVVDNDQGQEMQLMTTSSLIENQKKEDKATENIYI